MRTTLLQQVASHLLKVSLIKLGSETRRSGIDARIVACIHDSVWLEVPLDQESAVREIMETFMTKAMSLAVPLSVDFEE